MTLRLALLMVLCTAVSAPAQDCEAEATTAEMNACVERVWLAADAEMNAVYRAAIDHMRAMDEGLAAEDAVAEELLRAAQRAWVTFRNAACEAEGSAFHGGSIQGIIIGYCLERLTLARTDDLLLIAEADDQRDMGE